jgi:hypothetical protein
LGYNTVSSSASLLITLETTTTPTTSKSFPLRKVIEEYTPQLGDELGLVIGKDIVLLKEYNDGWGFGMDPVTKGKGAFPLLCLAPASAMDPQMSVGDDATLPSTTAEYDALYKGE